MLRRLFAVSAVAALAVVGAACSSDDPEGSSGDPTSSTSTTAATAAGDPAYAERGPYEVGTRTVALADGRRTVIWYPAADGAADAPTELFDITSLLSPELQAQVPAEMRPSYEIDAHPGADPATDGPFPLVLYSHGFAGYPELSSTLVTHMASWGFVVVAPDHVERSASGLLGTAAKGVEPLEDTEVLTQSIDAALADAEVDGSPLAGLIDPELVAVTGESAGASAAYLLPSVDPRVDAFIAYSLGAGRPDENGETPERPVPEVPGMVMAGSADGIIPAEDSKAIYDEMNTPKYFVELAEVGHTGFTDACLIGADQGGITGIIKAAGLDLPENLIRLASDGCGEDYLPAEEGFAAIDHFSVAFLRSSLGIDPEPVGLDQATADDFAPVEVTLSADEG